MAVHYGTLQEFRPEVEELTTYLERVDLFFTANETPEAKQVPIFLNVVGATTYSLLRSLLAPANPKDKSLADLAAVLKGHFEPKRNVVAERFRFHKRCQNQGESVASFVAELCRLAARCSFGNHLKSSITTTKAYHANLHTDLRVRPVFLATEVLISSVALFARFMPSLTLLARRHTSE